MRGVTLVLAIGIACLAFAGGQRAIQSNPLPPGSFNAKTGAYYTPDPSFPEIRVMERLLDESILRGRSGSVARELKTLAQNPKAEGPLSFFVQLYFTDEMLASRAATSVEKERILAQSLSDLKSASKILWRKNRNVPGFPRLPKVQTRQTLFRYLIEVERTAPVKRHKGPKLGSRSVWTRTTTFRSLEAF